MTKKVDGRELNRTGRTSQLNLKVREEFRSLVYELAKEENLLITQLVEKAIMEYKVNKEKLLIKLSNRERERERERERAKSTQKAKK